MNKLFSKIFAFFLISIFLISFNFLFTKAAQLQYISDTIADSAPSAPTSHTIKFQTTSGVPASGKIIITPQAGQFSIPTGFSFQDVDLGVGDSAAGPFIQRTLGPTPNAATDGVAVISGQNGNITFTLSSTAGISAGKFLEIKLGPIASAGTNGTLGIINPAGITSYKIDFNLKDSLNNPLDSGGAMIAVIYPVGLSAAVTAQTHIRSNGQPTGTLPAGTTQATMSLNTNYDAHCRYSSSPNISYSNMSGNFTDASGGTYHHTLLSGLQNGRSYAYYVKCSDGIFTDTTDYPISFSVQSGGGGGGGGGGPTPVKKAELILSGWAYPYSQIGMLVDGKLYTYSKADAKAAFKIQLNSMNEGTYLVGLYAVDNQGERSALYTLSLKTEKNKETKIENIIIPPTIRPNSFDLKKGQNLILSGQSAPLATVEIYLSGAKEILNAKVQADNGGNWKNQYPAASLKEPKYSAKAKTYINSIGSSPDSRVIEITIGKKPEKKECCGADLNCDGKVNLVDFSILMYYWDTDNKCADLNHDGKVNLPDFSIMMYYWTG